MVHVTASQQDSAPPPYTAPSSDDPPVGLSIVSNPEGRDFLITLSPPQEPTPSPDDPNKPGRRAPIDIVLVIDVSSSMDEKAPAPGDDEPTDLTVLDVVKHAVRTIVTSMGGDDRVSVVTFSASAKVVVPLTRADDGGKARVMGIVERLRTESTTNIWDGLKNGMNVLTSKTARSDLDPPVGQAPPGEKGADQPTRLPSERLSSIFLLTDGQPNVEPPRGHIPMLKLYLESHPPETTRFTINTFGFGYGLDSQLLNDIAAVGKGTYGFIPDAGMVGTVFVHAAANTYATFCNACELAIELEDSTLVNTLEDLGGLKTAKASWGVKIDLGAVQYGQTKDIVVRIPAGLRKGSLTATVKYRPWWSPSNSPDIAITRAINAGLFSPTVNFNLLYHIHRATFVQEIFSLFTGSNTPRGFPPPVSSNAIQRLTALAKTIQNDMSVGIADGRLRSDALALAKDIEGEVIMALNGKTDKGAFIKWGRHYLPSLARSHQLQQCSNFKDEGLQVYGRDSPLFVRSRNEMDSLFDNLPPPTPAYEVRPSHSAPYAIGRFPMLPRPSWIQHAPQAQQQQAQQQQVLQAQMAPMPFGLMAGMGPMHPRAPMSATSAMAPMPRPAPQAQQKSMAFWNQQAAPCFSGHCRVLAASDASGSPTVRVDKLRRGTKLQTPAGPRSVAAVIRTVTVDGHIDLCSVGQEGLLVTPWHPIKTRYEWEFPADVSPPQKVACEAVYSILLEPDRNSEAHSVWIGGVLCVTLGHGIVQPSENHDDVRAHAFLGDYNKVVASMVENLGFFDEEGVLDAYGTRKSEESGLVCGFLWKGDDKRGVRMQDTKVLEGLRHVVPV